MSSGAPNSPIGIVLQRPLARLVVRQDALAHRRHDDAGMHRVAADLVALAGAIHRHRLGELPHRALAGAIGRQRRRAEEGRQRRGVDDRAAARLLHRRHAVLAAEEHALDVDRQHALPLLDRLGLEGRGEGPGDAGVVDQPVELALARHQVVDDALPVGFLGGVVLLEAGIAADLLHGLEPARLVDVGHHHCRAFGRQQLRGGAADARPRPRHQHDLARNPAHASRP